MGTLVAVDVETIKIDYIPPDKRPIVREWFETSSHSDSGSELLHLHEDTPGGMELPAFSKGLTLAHFFETNSELVFSVHKAVHYCGVVHCVDHAIKPH